jgi:phosphatidylglycerophosphatase A
MLSESMPYQKKFITVNDKTIAYVDEVVGILLFFCMVIQPLHFCGAMLPQSYLPLAG